MRQVLLKGTKFGRTWLSLLFLVGTSSCGGGGGDAGLAPAPTPAPPTSIAFSFPVVSSTTIPQGCIREDGKSGVSAVIHYVQNVVNNAVDLVVLRCDSTSGRRLVSSRPSISPRLRHIDAAGTIVASFADGAGELATLVAMLPGSNQAIELAARSMPYPPNEFIAVVNNRALYISRSSGRATLVSVTIAQTPTVTVLGEVTGDILAHDRLIGGRVFGAAIATGANQTIEYFSVRPDGSDRLSLRSAQLPPNPLAAMNVIAVLRDREVVFVERTALSAVPSVRMAAVDVSGSDLLIAEASAERSLVVPGTSDRIVFLGGYPNRPGSILTDVNAERGNLSIRMLQLSLFTDRLLGFSQGRLYLSESVLATQTQNVAWLGEGGTAPNNVLAGIRQSYFVTDQAIGYGRAVTDSPPVIYAGSDLNGRNERRTANVSAFPSDAPFWAGNRIFYIKDRNTLANHVAAFDLTTGTESVVYQPVPAQDRLRFFRVGGRLIMWNEEPGAASGWIDSVDLDGNDRLRLDQSPDPSVLPQPF
jgi:hypothetical protein